MGWDYRVLDEGGSYYYRELHREFQSALESWRTALQVKIVRSQILRVAVKPPVLDDPLGVMLSDALHLLGLLWSDAVWSPPDD